MNRLLKRVAGRDSLRDLSRGKATVQRLLTFSCSFEDNELLALDKGTMLHATTFPCFYRFLAPPRSNALVRSPGPCFASRSRRRRRR